MIETETVSNLASQVPVILGRPFLASTNALINDRNGMMRLSFGNMTLELNTFNMRRHPSGFDDMEFSILHWVQDSIPADSFDDVFVAEYEPTNLGVTTSPVPSPFSFSFSLPSHNKKFTYSLYYL